MRKNGDRYRKDESKNEKNAAVTIIRIQIN